MRSLLHSFFFFFSEVMNYFSKNNIREGSSMSVKDPPDVHCQSLQRLTHLHVGV